MSARGSHDASQRQTTSTLAHPDARRSSAFRILTRAQIVRADSGRAVIFGSGTPGVTRSRGRSSCLGRLVISGSTWKCLLPSPCGLIAGGKGKLTVCSTVCGLVSATAGAGTGPRRWPSRVRIFRRARSPHALWPQGQERSHRSLVARHHMPVGSSTSPTVTCPP